MTGRREAEPTGGPSPAGDEAALSLGAEPVTIAADRQHVAVMQEPVEDRGGDHGTGEHSAPFGNTAVRGDQHGASFIAPADQLEEEMCRVRFQRQIAELVDDQQLWLRHASSFSSRRRSPCALARPATSVVAVVNCTV